ncbi:MAG TPA: SGNH/GDSL hydrolase family protein [Verrucomicrobiae bacterium]|jgi:lysophospholipase L1-like esterase|nr:SGNH/GDSL hydrolase family protein [Verrucomicrobiae bacterium]
MVALRILVALMLVVQAAWAAGPRFASEIEAFEASDKANPPPTNAILFVGSSSIRKWTSLARDFPDHRVINRGFGGSEISDSVYYFDRIVKPYHPRIIVFFAGSNDINGGKTPEQVFEDFKAFAGKVRDELPGTRLGYISISTSPSRWKQHEKVIEANRLIQDYIDKDSQCAFINVYPAMLGSDGKPNSNIYVLDRLHMNAKGYAIWRSIIAPYLDK